MSKIASLSTQRLPVGKLTPHPKNPRIHPPEGSPQWATMCASLEHDYFDPLVWNKANGMLVSGHFRAKVLAKQGFTEVDVVVVDYDESMHLARMVAANKASGVNDTVLMKELFAGLEEMGEFSLDEMSGLTGMLGQEISSLLGDFNPPPPSPGSPTYNPNNTGVKEVDPSSLSDTTHECPKCHFKY